MWYSIVLKQNDTRIKIQLFRKGEIAARGRRLGRKRRGMFYWKGGARDRSAS